MSRQQCIRESRIDRNLTRPPLQNPNEHNTAPEDTMQSDLMPESPHLVAIKQCDSHGCVFAPFVCKLGIESRRQNNC